MADTSEARSRCLARRLSPSLGQVTYGTHVLRFLCATALIGVVAYSAADSSAPAQAGGDPACPSMGRATAFGVDVPSCLSLYDAGPGIHLPSDTSTRVYGVAADGTFTTRAGSVAVSGPAWAAFTGSDAARVIVVARRSGTAVSNPRPVLYVDSAAILRPLAGQQGVLDIAWVAPPAGVTNGKGLLRFSRPAHATLANLSRPVRAGGECLPALSDPAYAPYFGSGHFTLTWFPAMHTPADSEIVLDAGTGPTWMTRGPQVADLMSGAWHPIEVAFGIHANPLGTPASLTGPLGPLKPLRSC